MFPKVYIKAYLDTLPNIIPIIDNPENIDIIHPFNKKFKINAFT